VTLGRCSTDTRLVSKPLSPDSLLLAPQNARALLRNALPIKNKQIRVAQQALESITDDLRVPGVRFSVRQKLALWQADVTCVLTAARR
jgi:hypothetical protein